MIRMNPMHDTKNPPGQANSNYETNLHKQSNGGAPEFKPNLQYTSEDFYDQYLFRQFFWNSEYDR